MLDTLMKALHGPIYAKRIDVLCGLALTHLRSGDRVLDVGCGSGAFGRALLDHPAAPPGLNVRGLERFPRDGARIDVDRHDGDAFPYADGAFDVVTVLDVLHHDPRPVEVLKECRRVARRLVIVKDHKPDGPAAQTRISLLDWAANRPHGVACLFQYPTRAQWHARFAQSGLTVDSERSTLRLYPKGWNWFFAGRLHYWAVLRPEDGAALDRPR